MDTKTRLNKEQQIAVSHINGPMLVLAGPGSGKTHLLIERIYNLINNGINPENILVITFSKKAALEMESRFRRRTDNNPYPVSFGTFHAVFFNILMYYKLYDLSSILTSKDKLSLLSDAARYLNIKKSNEKSYLYSALEKISAYKNIGNKIFDDSSSFFFDNEEKSEFLKLYKVYKRLCEENNKLDFDDMISKCIDLFKENKEIRKKWQERYKYILVDEFQDINNSQYEMLKLLEGDTKNVFVVGDDDQSIYGFRGACSNIMSLFLKDHDACKKVVLKLNYRCAYEIVEIADRSIRHNKDRIDRLKQQTLKHRKKGTVTIKNFDNEALEAKYISGEINNLLRAGIDDIAVIYRSEHCINLLEDELKILGVKYDRKERAYDFYSLDTVRIIVSYLRVIADMAALEDYLLILNNPQRGLSRNIFNNIDERISNESFFSNLYNYYRNELKVSKDDNRIKEIDALFKDITMLSNYPLMAVYFYLLKRIGLYNHLRLTFKKHPDINMGYEELIDEIENRIKGFSSIEGFLSFIDAQYTIKSKDNHYNPSDKGKVKFLTAHASKGLEFEAVFVAGLQEGLFPHRNNLKEPGIEEERRLFYVALTRAKQHLYLIGRGSIHGKIPSRFVNEVM